MIYEIKIRDSVNFMQAMGWLMEYERCRIPPAPTECDWTMRSFTGVGEFSKYHDPVTKNLKWGYIKHEPHFSPDWTFLFIERDLAVKFRLMGF